MVVCEAEADPGDGIYEDLFMQLEMPPEGRRAEAEGKDQKQRDVTF